MAYVYPTRTNQRQRKEGWSTKKLKAVIAAPLVFLFICMCYPTWRIYKAKGIYVHQLVQKRNQGKLLRELGDNESRRSTNCKARTQKKKIQSISQELKIFDFQAIVVATSNFSIINKLGEGGFGFVYKVKLCDYF